MVARQTRRFWSEDEKQRIVAQTYAPGVSVSQVRRRYDVNANLIFTWRRDSRYKPAADGEDAVPSIYSIVPLNDGSALRHGHHFELAGC